MAGKAGRLADIINRHEGELLRDWMRNQLAAVTARRDLIRDDELERDSRRFLSLFRGALQDGGAAADISSPGWAELRESLGELSRTRARLGFSPSETATFV